MDKNGKYSADQKGDGENMDNVIMSSLIALIGSLIGTFGGIITSTKLMNYKIDELQKQVEKHNNLIERTYDCEQKLAVHDEQLKVINHRISDLEKGGSHSE